MARIIVAGGNFSGLTSVLELRRKIGYDHEIILISKSPDFLFVPSLIWVPLGKRKLKDLTIPLNSIVRRADVHFICAEITEIIAEKKIVRCGDKDLNYDYLIIATGPEWVFDQIPGEGLGSNVSFIVNPEKVLEARQRWLKFITEPGPVVIGVVPGSQCTGPAYEFLFNIEKRCRELDIRKKVDITFVTSEPYLGHLGLGGIMGSNYILKTMLPLFNINYITNAEIREVTNQALLLKSGPKIPYKYLMIMPRFKGAKAVQDSKGLGNSEGFIPVYDTYQHKNYPHIFGVGIAADLPMQFRTPVAIGIPKTGYAADESAKTAAENIARLLRGNEPLERKPMSQIPELCIMDAGGKEMLSFSDSLLKPRRFSIILPNPFCNINKLMFEKYYLWKVRHGLSKLP
ncbi:NADH dehydrogenase, FAD-containing subunit [Desulfosporosinus orientis DSM 765]|uniref:NADH dehydrogenase, FAD-containing subunit n=1 Tax=Desulfosporosinus orientis (strain ATCC 19365 / DSM 765 / NCIMB 8382 / VKM B-1628 / Singapore I) TaxID=768706 RepID=G7W9N8_DESOD|nr:FAD-dependent oxidoreductase [Desulfosporosinus orientis]AET69955.1 NADH dehydrogenase, FAD-containing subunit [Desulfosporosinus orientis DSM 765]